MYTSESLHYHQRDLFALFPGVAGGRAIFEQRGAAYLAAIGATGGRTTYHRHGRDHMVRIGAAGRAARRARRTTQPQTLTILSTSYIEIIRIVPYWPPRSTKRRRHPIYVLIYLAAYNRIKGVEVGP